MLAGLEIHGKFYPDPNYPYGEPTDAGFVRVIGGMFSHNVLQEDLLNNPVQEAQVRLRGVEGAVLEGMYIEPSNGNNTPHFGGHGVWLSDCNNVQVKSVSMIAGDAGFKAYRAHDSIAISLHNCHSSDNAGWDHNIFFVGIAPHKLNCFQTSRVAEWELEVLEESL